MPVSMTHAPSALPVPAALDSVEGLEDLENDDDLSVPRIKILHRDALFEDDLSGQTFADLEVIVLGALKGRVLWEANLDDDDPMPLCKSLNGKVGRPDVETFPWDASAWSRSDFTGSPVELNCAACPLKDFGSHPSGQDKPWCTQQLTLPIMLKDRNGNFSAPSLLVAQRTSYTPAKKYAQSFQRAGAPMFTAVTKITLDARRRGSNPFAVMQFRRVGDSDPGENNALWSFYGDRLTRITEFLHTWRERDNESSTASVSPPPQQSTAQHAGSPATALGDDEDPPF